MTLIKKSNGRTFLIAIYELTNKRHKHLAFYADIDAANLCRIEAGKYSVGFDILTKIGYALDMEIDFVEPKKQ